MLDSIITIAIAGLLAGFVLSIPSAGPIGILITSNALKGRLRYCILVSFGALIADFTYVFIAVFGLTKFFAIYRPFIPYIFAVGCLFFFYLGNRIIKSKIDFENLEDKSHLTEKIQKKRKGAFITGLMINFLNPTLFIGVLTSSFFVISLIASLGLHTGGLAVNIDQNVKEIRSIQGRKIDTLNMTSIEKFKNFQKIKKIERPQDLTIYTKYFHLVISICYALFFSLGSILWFDILAYLLVRFRQRINRKVLAVFITSLGVVLCLFGLFFGYLSVRMFFHRK